QPDAPEAWCQLAATLITASRGIASVLEKGDCFDAARQAVERALAIDPGHGASLLQSGQFHTMMAYRNGDDPARGEGLLERAAADTRLTRRQRAEIAFYRGIAARARRRARRQGALRRVADDRPVVQGGDDRADGVSARRWTPRSSTTSCRRS
ncbi:MAG: hypothetical protein H0X38_13495, partial [Planctomycetes bacterium]|nr:hypothetical protein [Planctomycetota bacterium]